MKKLLITCILSMFSGILMMPLHGQTELKVDDVQVIKDFEARLKDFRKVQLVPVLPVYDISQRKYDYVISSKPLRLEYEKPQIRPLALQDLKTRTLKAGGLELGYGLPNAFQGDFHYGTSRDDFSSAVSIRHHSANNKNIEHQRYSRNAINFLMSDVLGNDVAFDSHIFANVDYLNLYGIHSNADTTIQFGNPQRRLMHLDLQTAIRKDELTDVLDGNFALKYNFLHNNQEQEVENNLQLKAGLDYRINDQFKMIVPVITDFSSGRENAIIPMFTFNPGFKYTKPFFHFQLAGEFAYLDQWAIFPEITLSANKIFGYFDIFAGTSQQAYLNSSYAKFMENPFFRMAGDSVLMTAEQGYYLGVRGDIEGAKFEVSTNYSKTSNEHFYVPSAIDGRQFDVLYDSLTDFSIEGSLSYEITRNITLTGSVAKHFYSTALLDNPWHKPGLEADFMARFSFFDNKLLVDGSLFFASGINYPDPQIGDTDMLPVVFDVSGKAQYELFNNFRVYVQWNNITATQYNRWYQYPSYRIHLLGGIKVLF